MADGRRSAAAPVSAGRRRAAPSRRGARSESSSSSRAPHHLDATATADPPIRVLAQPTEPSAAGSRGARLLVAVVVALWLASVITAAGVRAGAVDGIDVPALASRIAAAVATWLAATVLVRRCGGRYVLAGLFAAGVLAVAVAVPERWALAGAAVAAAVVHGLLGMVLTRPAAGLRALREVLVSAVVGAGGALAVIGYDVDLRPYRFRILVLAIVLAGGFALAWRLGHGVRSIGRRGVVVIAGGAALLVLSVAYTQAIRAWASPEVKAGVDEAQRWMLQRLGAVPRPIEALVGFPALMWGVAIRNRRRQGWWMCAFGGLGASGIATSLVFRSVPLAESVLASGYDVALGAVLGLVVIALDRLLTGPRGRRAHSAAGELERPEPRRFAPLL